MFLLRFQHWSGQHSRCLGGCRKVQLKNSEDCGLPPPRATAAQAKRPIFYPSYISVVGYKNNNSFQRQQLKTRKCHHLGRHLTGVLIRDENIENNNLRPTIFITTDFKEISILDTVSWHEYSKKHWTWQNDCQLKQPMEHKFQFKFDKSIIIDFAASWTLLEKKSSL